MLRIRAKDLAKGMNVYSFDGIGKRVIHGKIHSVGYVKFSSAGDHLTIDFGPGKSSIDVPSDAIFYVAS